MNTDLVTRELFAQITIGDLIYLGSALVVAILVASTIRFISSRVKKRLNARNVRNLPSQLISDLDRPLVLWIIVAGFYFGLLVIPPLVKYHATLTLVFRVYSIVSLVYIGLKIQGKTIEWAVSRIGQGTAREKMMNSLIPMTRQIGSLLILAMGGLIILDQLGISIAPLIAGLGIGGLAVALALQGTLTNFFAGLNVMTDGSIREGDFVELDGGMVGTVEQIGWRSTRIRLLADNMVIVPNARLADNLSVNYNYPEEEMSVYLQVGVAYSSNLEHVEQVTVEVARKVLAETPGSVQPYEPSVWYTDFGDSNINFWVVLRAKNYLESWTVKHAFVKALFQRYNEEGIEISFPARNIYMRSDT